MPERKPEPKPGHAAALIAVESIAGYHAHVYYDPQHPEPAAALRAELEKHFAVRLGRWHPQPVGPHPTAMYQVAFEPNEFSRLVPWLMLHRQGLTILIHPQTGDAYSDHVKHALWLGEQFALNAEVLRSAKS